MKKVDQQPAGETNEIVRIFGRLLDGSGDCAAYEDERFANWLAHEALSRVSAEDRRDCERVAREVASRAQSRIRALRVGEAIPSLPIRARSAGVVGNVKQVAPIATECGCAPWLESLPVAAGVGREIWDEPCEQWVELPEVAKGREHIALNVAGDSMMPWLRPGDVILVNTQGRVARDSLVVARHGEHGYVVKHVTRCGRAELELSSFNRAYAPFVIERSPGSVIGVVVARLERDGGGS